MKRKTFGLGNIIFGILISIAIFILGSWSKLKNGDSVEFLCSLILFLIVTAFFFNNYIVVQNYLISLIYFNPFKKNVSIDFNEMENVNIKIDGYKWSFGKVIIYRKNGIKERLSNLSSRDS